MCLCICRRTSFGLRTQTWMWVINTARPGWNLEQHSLIKSSCVAPQRECDDPKKVLEVGESAIYWPCCWAALRSLYTVNSRQVTEAWQWLGLDVRGPLGRTAAGNRYILSVTDLFSQWVESVALESCLPLLVAQHLADITQHFGFPVRILSRLPRDTVDQVGGAWGGGERRVVMVLNRKWICCCLCCRSTPDWSSNSRSPTTWSSITGRRTLQMAVRSSWSTGAFLRVACRGRFLMRRSVYF